MRCVCNEEMQPVKILGHYWFECPFCSTQTKTKKIIVSKTEV